MKVICTHNKTCKNIDCYHRTEHEHYNMCKHDCTYQGHTTAKCDAVNKVIRKEKLNLLNEGR